MFAIADKSTSIQHLHFTCEKNSFSKKIPRNPDATQKTRFSGKNPEVVTLFITLRNFRFSFRCLLLPAQQREVRWWLVCK